MPLDVVWKLGSPVRKGLHAFFAPGDAGTQALCSDAVKADGHPLAVSKVTPRCPDCVKRMAMAERFGITCQRQMPKNFAGLVRSQSLAEERKSHWRVERHGGRRRDDWWTLFHAPQPGARHTYNTIKGELSNASKSRRRRGGVRLVDPDGHVDCEFIKSPWLKEAESAGSNAAV